MNMPKTFIDYYNAPPKWEAPVIIESHINGIRPKVHNPNIPVTYEEISNEAMKLWEAGACVVHLHNTSIMLTGKEAYEDYRKCMEGALKKYPNMLWHPTNTALPPGYEGCGVEHVELLSINNGVKLCTVDSGSANLPFAVDENKNIIGVTYGVPFEALNRQIEICEKNNLGMIWGIYEPGYLRTALLYDKMGRRTNGTSIDLYFQGDYGTSAMTPINTCGVPPTVESLYFYLNLMEDCDLPWYISIWGEGGFDTKPLIKRAIELGGHIKTGLELHFDPDRKPTNIELLEEVREIAREVGRPLATQEEVGKILNFK